MTHQERMESAIQYSYETGCRIHDNYINVRKRLKAAPKVCILGLGNLFSEFSKVVFKELFAELNIFCVSDDNEENWGKEFLGVPCIPPQELTKIDDIVVLITADKYLSVKNEMTAMGLESYFIGECYLGYFDSPKSAQWIMDSKADILKAYSLLEDERSKEIYVELLCQKLAPHLATKEFYRICEQGEYFYKGIMNLSDDECFVDCGAYIGDTVESFIHESGGRYKSIIAFEPDKLNYAVAVNAVKEHGWEHVQFYNCGLSNANSHPVAELLQQKDLENIEVPDKLPEDSMIAVNIRRVASDVRMGRLDDLLEGNPTTFLKIDVEGFEEDTLNGAIKTVSEQKPKVAICIYHQLQHLWILPLMLHEFRPDYKLYIRHHSNMVYDTVCYAI